MTKTNHQETEKQLIQAPDCDYRAQNKYMQMAIDEARSGIHNGHGGPFGSVIVKEGKILAKGHNTVLSGIDSTAHGEINAIRKAERTIGSHDLKGCEIYTTGEPCPMCLAACLWANIDRVYYGCTIADNADIGFRDELFDQKFGGRRGLEDYLIKTDREACLKLFDEYNGLNPQNY